MILKTENKVKNSHSFKDIKLFLYYNSGINICLSGIIPEDFSRQGGIFQT